MAPSDLLSKRGDQRGASSSEPRNDGREREREESNSLGAITPSEFLEFVNRTLEYAYSSATIVGEVASFKVNQGKWVFFDLKDEESSISCFMPVWELRVPLEDGMKIMAHGTPKVTKWGKFSFTVSKVAPVGEGSLKKAYELLKKKLAAEGLFDPAKKRPLPTDLAKIGVISSRQAAGYADFIKILNARWGGLEVQVAHTQVQGLDAPDQIIRALNYFNQKGEVQIIAILRGGGSADDLACFNDEALVRAIAASKIPVITGIGHEVDESLSDLAADLRASTPSNAAEILTPDKARMKESVKKTIQNLGRDLAHKISAINKGKIEQCLRRIQDSLIEHEQNLASKVKLLEVLNPEKVLKRGYAILSGKISPGNVVKITTFNAEIKALVKEVHERKKESK